MTLRKAIDKPKSPLTTLACKKLGYEVEELNPKSLAEYKLSLGDAAL